MPKTNLGTSTLNWQIVELGKYSLSFYKGNIGFTARTVRVSFSSPIWASVNNCRCSDEAEAE
jgi:hypothetical protein